MAVYKYIAVDRSGREVSGAVDALSLAEAEQALRERGLELRDVREDPSGKSATLTADESSQLVEQVAELSSSGLSLPSGLRAAAAETSSRRLAAALNQLAAKIDAGYSLEQALEQSQVRWPSRLKALAEAAVKTGNLGGVLAEVLEHQREAAEMNRSILAALAYPFLVLVLALLVFAFISVIVVGHFAEMFAEFELELPANTTAAMWMAKTGVWILLGTAAGLVLLLPLARLLLGPQRFGSLLAALPVIGPAWRWSSIAEFARVAGTLLAHRIPLPDALRLAAEANSDAHLADTWTDVSNDVQGGKGLARAIDADGRLPASIVPLVRWGETMDALPEAFDGVREMFEERARLRALWIRAVAPPVVFVVVGVAILNFVFAVVAPMVELINKLT